MDENLDVVTGLDTTLPEENLDPTQTLHDSPKAIFTQPEDISSPEGEPLSAWDNFESRFLENSVYTNVVRMNQKNTMNENIDADFEANDLTYERINADLKERGLENLPLHKMEDLANSTNLVGYYHNLNRIEEWQKSSDELAKLGGLKALGVEIASYAADPIGLVAEGAVALKTTGTLLRRMLVSGGRGMLADTLLETIRAGDEAVDPKDFTIGVASSFIVSGGIGALTGAEIKAVKDMKQAFDVDVGVKPDGSFGSAGAALNKEAEIVDPNLQLPSDLTSDILKDKIIEEGIMGSKWLGATYSVRAQGQKVKYDPLRKLNEMVHGVAIKADKDQVRPITIMDRATLLEGKSDALLQNDYTVNFSSWANEVHGKGKLSQQFAAEVQQDFSTSVGRYLLTNGSEDVASQVSAAANGFKKFYRSIAENLERAGVVKKGRLTSNEDFGMPRIMSYSKARALQQKIGAGSDTFIRELIEEGIEKARLEKGLDFDPKITKLVAKAYHKRMFTAPVGEGGFKRSDNVLGLDLNDREFIDELLVGQDVDDINEVTKILDDLKKTEASSDSPRLEKRLTLDLGTSKTLFDGSVIKLSDFFEDDAQKIAYNYGKWASAETALHEQGLSLKKIEDFGTELRTKAAANKEGLEVNGVTDRDVANFDFTERAIKGLSVETDPNSFANRAGRIANAISYMNKMDLAGLNAITEAGTVLAAGQLKNLFRRNGTLKKLIKDVVSGKVSDDYMRQVHMMMGGLGDTWTRNTASLKHVAEVTTKHHDKLSGVENVVEGGKRVATAFNGLSHITDVTRRLSAVQGMDMLDSLATGRKLPSWTKRRFKDWTLSNKRKKVITDWLSNSDNVKRGDAGELIDIGTDKMPDDVVRYMEEFIYSFTSHNIQQTTKSNLPKVFQHPLGRILLQFRSFTAGAWENHVLTDASFRDTLAAKKLLFTGSLGMAMYAARVHINHPFEEDKRKELLTLDNMVRSGATYAVNTALVPEVVDTISRKIPGITAPVIGKKRTSGLESSFGLGGVPAATIISDVSHAANIPGDLATGGDLSREQLKSLFAVTMLDSFWPTRGIKNYLASDLPRENERE